jgi:hypothetical protein
VWRPRIVFVLVAGYLALCVVVAAGRWRADRPLPPLSSSCVARQEGRYATARPHLPRRGFIGFVGPETLDARCHGRFVAQYTLAPLNVFRLEDALNDAFLRARGLAPSSDRVHVLVDASDETGRAWLEEHPEAEGITTSADVVVVRLERATP